MENEKSRLTLCSLGILLVAFLAIGAEPASGITSRTYLLRYAGTSTRKISARGRSRIDSESFSSIHLLTVKGKSSFTGRFFTAGKREKSSVNGQEIPQAKIQPSRPVLRQGEYSPLRESKGSRNLSLGNALSLAGFREFVYLANRKLEKGETFETNFESKLGKFTARYEVKGECKVRNKTCVLITRTISLVKAKKGLRLSIEKWDEEIAFETRLKLPLRRKLHYVFASPGQRAEITFETEATEIKTVSASDLKIEEQRWAPALALNKALNEGKPGTIRKAITAVRPDGDFAPLALYASHYIELASARCKVLKGFNILKVPEHKTYYCLYVPEDYDAKRKYTLIIALHGAGGQPNSMARIWIPFAEKNHAIVLAPKSIGATWNTGVDMIVLKKALNEVSDTYNIDSGKKVLFGFSAGAAVSYVAHFFMEGHSFKALISACGHMQMAKMRDLINQKIDKFKPKIKGACFYLLTGERDHARNGVKSDRDFLKKHGGLVEFVEVPGMGHAFSGELIPPIYEWLAKALGEE